MYCVCHLWPSWLYSVLTSTAVIMLDNVRRNWSQVHVCCFVPSNNIADAPRAGKISWLVEFSEFFFVVFFPPRFFIINALNSVIFVNVSKCLILKSTNSRSKLVYKTKRPSLLGSLWFGLYSKIQSIEKCPAFLELRSQQRNAQCEENIYLCDVVSEIPGHSCELTLCLGPALCPGALLAQNSSSCRMEP